MRGPSVPFGRLSDGQPGKVTESAPEPGSLSRRRLERGLEPDAVHRLDELLDGDPRGIERHHGLLLPEAHLRSAHTLEPFQGPLDRERSRPSGHPLDR